MKKNYYVTMHTQFNGDHEVHDETCRYMFGITNRLYLGEFYSCTEAVVEAKKSYARADGCKFCSPTCHTR